MPINGLETILYVADQARARAFYATVLDRQPSLDVPGMTEFPIAGAATLGLMPEQGIARIISPPMPHPATGAGIPRCELYLRCADADAMFARATAAGAASISPPAWRDWGERVAYVADPDGHVLAFADRHVASPG